MHDEKRAIRHLMDALPMGVVVQDSEGRVVDANQAAQRILGCSVASMAAPFAACWDAIGPDGRALSAMEL
ncbi:MAG: PAS domain-containing protein, partial [Rhodoferax sp.]